MFSYLLPVLMFRNWSERHEQEKEHKILAALAMGMTMLFAVAGGTVNAVAPLHYFMQQSGNYESATTSVFIDNRRMVR